jgi:alcohol dehydrogenase class IV
MLQASYRAGVAFTQAYVGYAHAVAHALGGLYGMPHGLANAVILPYVLDWYGAAAHKRLAQMAKAAGIPGEDNAELACAFIARIREMNARMSIPETFDCIREEDIPLIAKRAMKEANPLYPVPKIMRQEECEALVRELMG